MGTRAASPAMSTHAQRRRRTTGIVRDVDERGRIVIPIEIRTRLASLRRHRSRAVCDACIAELPAGGQPGRAGAHGEEDNR
jgi:hypothetical protein